MTEIAQKLFSLPKLPHNAVQGSSKGRKVIVSIGMEKNLKSIGAAKKANKLAGSCINLFLREHPTSAILGKFCIIIAQE